MLDSCVQQSESVIHIHIHIHIYLHSFLFWGCCLKFGKICTNKKIILNFLCITIVLLWRSNKSSFLTVGERKWHTTNGDMGMGNRNFAEHVIILV